VGTTEALQQSAPGCGRYVPNLSTKRAMPQAKLSGMGRKKN
jgi:hypothetical protein